MDKKSRDLVMGKLHFKNKDFKTAEKCFLEFLSSNPDDFQALKLLAQVYEHLRNYRKAFELYERCYLAEPERKGVLLDICRLLLMNDVGLENVDQRKWLSLAIQAFPSNPIVLNLKGSLPSQEPAPTKIQDNILEEIRAMYAQQTSQVIKSLTGLSEKIDSLEKRLDALTLEPKTASKSKSASNNKSALTPKPAPEPKLVPAPKLAPEPKSTPEIKSAPEPKPVSEPKFVPDFKPASNPKPTLEFKSTLDFKPAFDLKSTFDPKPTFDSKPTFDPKPSPDPKPTPETKSNPESQPASDAKPAFSFMSSFESNGQASNPFGFSGLNVGSGPNLFAESLKKLNLPIEGTWTQKAAEAEDDGDEEEEGESSKQEELPIENTCDMQPIEIKSGEEDEDIELEQRCKLYRFRDGEYKERGIGQIKVLKHKTNNRGRLIMRREVINKVCLNCWTVTNISHPQERAVRFGGIDASDGEPVSTVFLVKFKHDEMAENFMKKLQELFPTEE